MKARIVAIVTVIAASTAAAADGTRKFESLVGVNWQPLPAASTPGGSTAWFFDPAQNRVMACVSKDNAPEPRCYVSTLPQPQANPKP